MIDIDHVSFQYSGAEQENLQDFNLQIKKGECVVLTGESGCGKTCVTRLINTLIPHFYEGEMSGAVLIDGVDTRTIQPHDLSDKIGSVFQNPRSQFFSLDTDSEIVFGMENKGMSYMSFVFQDVTLFNDTVMNNIRLGNPNATDDQVIAAAKAAYCDEFVREMPDGYQTVLGENGSTLSGGERQRISIARALLKNAPIILLDEATASLDPENEVLVQKAIAKLVEGKTVIMIAHRLRTVVDADQILVLDNGRLVEHGTHDELMKKNGLYHKLFHIQQESLGWAV